jgi:hypothetical protein
MCRCFVIEGGHRLKIYNKRQGGIPATAVYVGRPSAYGNPFSHLPNTLAQYQVSSRAEAVEKYREWILTRPNLLRMVRAYLAGKDLVCWCAPAKCHAEVLMEIANETEA